MCAQLLSSASIITIITLVMERLRTVGVRPRTADDGPRCTGCTTFVPRTNTMCGTPATPKPVGFRSGKHKVYRVYHRICVSFRNGPWTVVIESLFDLLNNRYKWYTCHVSQLTQGFPVYRHGNCAGTPFSESSINIRLCGVPGCTAKVIIRPSAEFPDGVLCN
jgi:hypothetical protein